MDNILLGKENGTFQISCNNLIIKRVKSVLEAWSKKDGRDEWGTFISTENITLEIVTYEFTKQYSQVMSRWELLIQANTETKRDGYFSSNTSFINAWYFNTISNHNTAIKIPDKH